MDPRTTFRFEAGDIRFEVSGSEEFVRKNLSAFLPVVAVVVGVSSTAAPVAHAAPSSAPSAPSAPSSALPVAPSSAPSAAPASFAAAVAPAAPAAPAAAATPAAPMELGPWYEKHVPAASRISMQDQILVFAYWMRGFRKFIFTSEDIRRGFETIGQQEPKSLLQILGTLKRDHNLILGTERRGEYMLNTTGIERVREILGIPRPGAARDAGAAPREPGDAERAARAVLDI